MLCTKIYLFFLNKFSLFYFFKKRCLPHNYKKLREIGIIEEGVEKYVENKTLYVTNEMVAFENNQEVKNLYIFMN